MLKRSAANLNMHNNWILFYHIDWCIIFVYFCPSTVRFLFCYIEMTGHPPVFVMFEGFQGRDITNLDSYDVFSKK